MKTAASILSAGFSQRMGSHKALLPIGRGETFISHIVNTLKEAGIYDIFVVISSEEIKKMSIDLKVEWIFNEMPEKGQLFSFQLCVKRAEKSKVDGIFLVPVDHPFVKASTYKKLLGEKETDLILIPTFQGKRGHPTYFPRRFFKDILEAPLDIGARYVLKQRKEEILEIPVDDEGILLDIDTRSDFFKAMKLFKKVEDKKA